MLSIFDILLTVLCTRAAIASPVRRYLNTTSIDRYPYNIALASPKASIGITLSDGPQAITLITTSAASMPARSTHTVDIASSACPDDSELASPTGLPTPAHDSSAKETLPTSHAGIRPTGKYNGQHAADGRSDHGTTTLTLYTTLAPLTQTRGFSQAPGSSKQHGSYGGPSQIGGSSTTLLSTTATNAETSKNTERAKPSSSPLVWGTFTLTYDMPSESATSSVIATPSHTSKPGKTRRPKHINATPTRESSAFSSSHATVSPSDVGSSSAATVDPTQPSQSAASPSYSYSPPEQSTRPHSRPEQPTSNPAPSQSYSYSPTGQPSLGLPPVVSQQFSTSSTAVAVSSSTTSAIGGITIVPVDPAATTVFVTVITTEAGVTMTVAK
ncbi:hypothetical protein LTR37_010573 [Vermiconidia calcicola]|uniref:Uncharacterized protein n=1 Tax=Vermiconidia calcicola TaxID=1690605 RepID=A0ACC3N5S3_9PEZI|nr:hypothetical protein LTR37_010573 [Vermiconidia calcicola]